MPVPKQKKGRMRVHSRRAQHDKIGAPALAECSQCHAMKLSHTVCPECGYYAGREVVEKS